MPSLLKIVTIQPLKPRETESHSVGLVRGPPCSPCLDRKEGALHPHVKASASLHRALLGCPGLMAPVSQDQGGQSPHFQKRISFPITTGHAGLHRPDLGHRRGPSLPYSQGHMGQLPMGTAGGPPPLTFLGPGQQPCPSLKSARTRMGRRESPRMLRIASWLARPPSLKDQNKPSSWEIEALHLSSLEAKGGLCCLSLKDPGEALLPPSLEVREAHPLAILGAQGGRIPVSLKLPGVPILVSLKGPEAKHLVSCKDPGESSLSSSKSKG